MNRLRTIRLVALFDLYESLRSRKAIALFLLYALVALGFSAIFITVFNRAFRELNAELGTEGVATFLESEKLVDAVAENLFDNDKDLARELLSTPPLALSYLWLATTFIPLVVVLTSADAISSAVHTGSIRFVLFRADRIDWVLGKLLGQTFLMVVGILIGAAATFLLGVAMLDTMEVGRTGWWLLVMTGRASFYGFAYLGVALCASQLVRGPWAARGIAFGLLFLLWVIGGILGSDWAAEAAPKFSNAAHQIFPNAHSLDLYRPDFGSRGVAMAALLLIGGCWFGLGMLRFRARDA